MCHRPRHLGVDTDDGYCITYVLDLDDQPVCADHDPAFAGHWLGEYRRRGLHRVGHYVHRDVMVSTVFLGINHQFEPGSQPVLWETVIFWPGHELDNATWRYTSRKEAQAGHAAVVELVRQQQNGVLPCATPTT